MEPKARPRHVELGPSYVQPTVSVPGIRVVTTCEDPGTLNVSYH